MPMIDKKLFFAASVVAIQLAISPAFAQSTPQLDREQLGDSAAPDVDPGASKGTDESIVKQEGDQLDNSTAPDVDASASKGVDESIVKQEQGQIPH